MIGLVESYCAEGSYSDYLNNIKYEQLKAEVDVWLIKYDKWLGMVAYKAERRCRMPIGSWHDLKSELILQAYACIDRFDSDRGVPISAFIVSSLWNYAMRKDIREKYSRMKEASYDNMQAKHDILSHWQDSRLTELFYDRREVSSLERANNVLSMLNTLPENERMLMKLHFEIGLQLKQIDEMMGCSRATTWHRIKRIVENLQTQIKVSG